MPQSPAAPSHAQQALDAMHPICSHDLPNQVVALQSLLQLFAWDEGEKLSPQGREYLERLQSVAGKTVAYVQFLKDLTRLHRHTCQLESLDLQQMVAEARAATQQIHPKHTWSWQCRFDVPQVLGDRKLVHKGLMQLLRLTALRQEAGTTAVEMRTIAQPGQVLWSIAAVPSAGKPPAGAEASLIEQQLALALAHAYLGATDIVCRQVEGPSAGAISFALVIPDRSPHD